MEAWVLTQRCDFSRTLSRLEKGFSDYSLYKASLEVSDSKGTNLLGDFHSPFYQVPSVVGARIRMGSVSSLG